MAEIKPLRAWRYNHNLAQNITELTSPLFDVVSKKQREKLYQNPYNSIHLSVPLGENPPSSARATLQKWKAEGIILQDPIPAIYVYYQYFSLPGSKKTYCRKGFICDIKAYDWKENILLRHENTIPKAVDERIALLVHTELNVSPTHGLYTDPGFELEEFMDESMRYPLYETEDYQGVKDVLSVIQDARVIERFKNVVREKQIILADGHHRYESSLAYRKTKMKENKAHTGKEAYNYHMMFLTNMEADDLRILPTHRLVSGLRSFDPEEFLTTLSQYFIIKEVENVCDINEVILGKKWAFGLILKDNAYLIRLRPEVFPSLHWHFPEVVKALDLTVMHYFVFEKTLGIPGQKQRKSDHIEFERSFVDCITKVANGEVQLALITQEIGMEEVKSVCFSGYTLPQKSTYFYPKTISGFLFGSIKESENSIVDCMPMLNLNL